LLRKPQEKNSARLIGFVPELIDRYSPCKETCSWARSFAIGQPSRLSALPKGCRWIALSKEKLFDRTDGIRNAFQLISLSSEQGARARQD
jgi:hypothetical protein